jgi:hypothetical protein
MIECPQPPLARTAQVRTVADDPLTMTDRALRAVARLAGQPRR